MTKAAPTITPEDVEPSEAEVGSPRGGEEGPADTMSSWTPSRNDSASGLYVDEVFEAVVALPPGEREAALAARCAGHASVEAEVRALLRAADDAPESVETPGGAVRLGPGARVGRYRLEHPLGRGATASVWKAFDTRLQAFTALKLLHPDGRIRGTSALEAVLHEARAASAIISDHVVRIKTAGRFEGGPHFVEMELCAEHRAGSDGTEILETGRSLAEATLGSIEEKVRVVAEAARGVDAAHRVGVLHRDLKPGNILLTPVSRRAKVTDFGLAAEQLYAPPTEETPATQTVTVLLEARDGRVVGTPAYMPPEQAMGHPATRAGDVYGLGATLYALLAGRAPYVARGRHAMPALDVLAQVREGPPDELCAVSKVPARLARIVARAMDRSPRERYRTALELALDLEAWLADRPTSVDGRAPVLRSWLFVRRNREVVGTAAVLLVVLLGFAAAVGWLDLRRRVLESDIASALEEREAAQAESARAADLRDRTEAERQQALVDLRAAEEALKTAEEARTAAIEGESNADRRWREELERRKAAEEARTLAEAARNVAEGERAAAAASRDLALAEAEAVRTELAETSARLAEEEAARLWAEEAARAAELARNEVELALARLEEALRRERAARAMAEEERDALEQQLDVTATAMGSPVPPLVSPVEPEAAVVEEAVALEPASSGP